MRYALVLAAGFALVAHGAPASAATSVLFIGNSFTYGAGSPVRFYRSDSVTDLNNEGIGGMPALFKSFADQAGLDYDVSLETRGGSNLDFHLTEKREVIGAHAWDAVVMHGYSTLDRENPRDPTRFIALSTQMAEFLRDKNRRVDVYLMATWSRADQTYPESGAWAGEPIYAMARDVRAAYDTAAEAADAAAVIPVGDAWNLAMRSGVADPNPYDGVDPDKVSLWTYDHYHASTHGLYLEALVVFGVLTGRDPRSLGELECSAYELGFSRSQAAQLQQVAYEQLLSDGLIEAMPDPEAPEAPAQSAPMNPQRCRVAATSRGR